MGLPQSIIDKWREELGEPVKVIETDTKLIIKKENGNKVVDFDKKSEPFLFIESIIQFDSFAETVNYIKKFWDESPRKRRRIMKKTIEEVRDWLLENRVDVHGSLDLIGLDFSDFDGDVYIDEMKVKRDLLQSYQEVQGNLYQSHHKVQGDYFSKGIEVEGNIEFDEPTKMLKKITIEELKEMGYELTEDY